MSNISNYLTPFLIIISYPYNYFTPSFIHQHGYEKGKLTCVAMILILIESKFNININNDELLKIIWEHYFF